MAMETKQASPMSKMDTATKYSFVILDLYI